MTTPRTGAAFRHRAMRAFTTALAAALALAGLVAGSAATASAATQSAAGLTVPAAPAATPGPPSFGPHVYSLFFEPGTYGSAADPLIFQVGYYTQVAGLGALPGDVVINGSADVYNQCSAGSCTALDNFWRSLSNLTINVAAPPNVSPVPCLDSNEFWATSQASPMRRVDINGTLTLFDYCSNPGYSSGGF